MDGGEPGLSKGALGDFAFADAVEGGALVVGEGVVLAWGFGDGEDWVWGGGWGVVGFGVSDGGNTSVVETLSEFLGGFDDAALVGSADEGYSSVVVVDEVGVAGEEIAARIHHLLPSERG